MRGVNRATAAAGAAVFFLIAPGVVAGLVPWLITGWRVAHPLPVWLPLRAVGWILLVLGVSVLVSAFIRFVTEGIGTPAPVAPPKHLMVGGFYRYVRNPMYLAVLTTIDGQSLVLILLAYAAVVAAAFVAMIHWHEKPALRASRSPARPMPNSPPPHSSTRCTEKAPTSNSRT
jgi:protein-S-isoprenylcysteine O-methyltransferase Ste14